jgi:hypothetical protein
MPINSQRPFRMGRSSSMLKSQLVSLKIELT